MSDDQSDQIATPILGLNLIAAVCLSGVFVILKINHQSSQIKWHSGLFMISFISFLTSAIILVALQCLTLLTDADFKKEDIDSRAEDWSAKKQMMQITMSSASFSLGLLALGSVLDRKVTTRSFSLFCFIPLTQLCIERFIFAEDKLTKV